jgi:hypothetical protein
VTRTSDPTPPSAQPPRNYPLLPPSRPAPPLPPGATATPRAPPLPEPAAPLPPTPPPPPVPGPPAPAPIPPRGRFGAQPASRSVRSTLLPDQRREKVSVRAQRFIDNPDVQFSPCSAAPPDWAQTYRHGFPLTTEELLARGLTSVTLKPGPPSSCPLARGTRPLASRVNRCPSSWWSAPPPAWRSC